METRAPTKGLLLIPAVFALAAVMLVAFVWVSFGGSVPFGAEGYRLTVDFPVANNLFPNDDVRIAGVNVGKVMTVTRVGNSVQALLQIESQYAPLRTGARAVMRTKSLLGEAYIEMSPGTAGAPPLKDGARLPAGDVVAAQQLADTLATFNPSTRQQLQALLAGLSQGLAGRGPDLSNGLGWAAPTTANLGTVLSILDRQRSSVTKLIGSGGQLLTAVGQQAGAVQTAVTAGDAVLTVTADRSRALEQTVNELPAFLRQVRSTSVTAAAASGDINRAVAALQPVAPLITPALAASDELSPQLRALFRALPSTISAARPALPAAAHVLNAAMPALAALDAAGRQLVPVLQLAAAVRRSIVAVFANFGAADLGTEPGDPDEHYLSGLPLFWNEMIGGYLHRPPTNRQNSYPAPNSVLDIASGGLKAYDCKNVNNPLLVPAIGTGAGAPPCVVQGPWTFNGLTKYFPDLQPAKP